MAQVDKLNKEYQKLMEQSFKLSSKNRAASDAKFAEAQEILKQIEALEK